MAGLTSQPTHRTQEQRRDATRGALLDATVTALATHGYAGTTTTLVAQIAGVSRGAQVHHFHTKAQLVAAAIQHVAQRRAAQLLGELGTLPSDPADRTVVALDLLWRSHSGPLFDAAIELWVAARTDDELRRDLLAVETDLTAGVRTFCAALFDADADDPAFTRALDISLAAIRGTALLAQLAGGDAPAVQRDWALCRSHLASLFPPPRPTPPRSTTP